MDVENMLIALIIALIAALVLTVLGLDVGAALMCAIGLLFWAVWFVVIAVVWVVICGYAIARLLFTPGRTK